MTSASLKTTIAHWVLNGSLLGLEPNGRKRDHAVKRVTAVIILILLQLLLVLPLLLYCNKTRPHFIKLDTFSCSIAGSVAETGASPSQRVTVW